MPVNDGRFHSVIISVSSGVLSIVIDGALDSSKAIGAGSSVLDSLYKNTFGNNLSGILANLKIYDNGTLIRDYPLDDNSNILRDKANGQSGTVINGNASDWGLFKELPTLWKGQDLTVPPWDSVDQELPKA